MNHFPKKFYIQLTQGGDWITEYGHSICHVMTSLTGDYERMPYNYIVLDNNPV